MKLICRQATLTERRVLFARILLTVFVAMLLVATAHRHADGVATGESCIECAQHAPHGGHLSAQTFSIDDCVLCQWGALPYLLPTVVVFLVYVSPHKIRCHATAAPALWRQSSCISLRAPPASPR